MSALYQRQGSRTKSMENMSGGHRISRADRFSSVASAKDAGELMGYFSRRFGADWILVLHWDALV